LEAEFLRNSDSYNYAFKPHAWITMAVISYETHWRAMAKLTGYVRVSTRHQVTDLQEADILAAGVRHDDLYVDRGASGIRASRPQFDKAKNALEPGDTLVITTLDRLGRSTQNMLDFAQQLRARDAGLRVLNLGGSDVDTATPIGSMLFTIMAALAQMEHDIKRERIIDSISKRSAAGKDLGGRPQRITDSQIRSAVQLVEGGEPVAQVARDLGMSRANFYRRSRAPAPVLTAPTRPAP
jgi:DNA invertase Pin-like site-specific DNA recombinase